MTSSAERPVLVEEVLSGGRRDLQVLAAEGLLPLPIGELVSVQVALTGAEDEHVADLAARSLAEIDPEVAARVIGDGAEGQVVSYLAFHRPHSKVLEAVLQLRDVSHDLLEKLAPRLGAEMQEILLLRQDAIVESPSILDALDANTQLSPYSRRRIKEYRDHLLPREKRPRTAAEVEEEAERLTDEDVQEAIAEATEVPSEGQVEDLTGLTESQIRTLAAPVRLKLARGAPRSLRAILIRDSNPQIAVSVLFSNPLTEGEVEEMAGNRSVRSEVLLAISGNRSWMRRYSIVHALVRNPRSPAGLAIRLVPRLRPHDLRAISRDHNVPHAVRAAAGRTYRMKRI